LLTFAIGSILAKRYIGRPIQESTASRLVLDRAASWIENCGKTHNCRKADDVLDLSCVESGRITLLDSSDLKGQYVALSHCWGDQGHFTTSKATLESRKGIEVDSLPQCFQGAIVVTQYLGVRFLWTDSLCTCQDVANDWARESAVMCELYANTYVVIAADSASTHTWSLHLRSIRSVGWAL
jgi:Heterokaryon incompatibility protein (HET)